MTGARLAAGGYHQFVQHWALACQMLALAVRGAAALQRQELFFQRLQAVQAAAHAGDLVGYEPIHVGAVGAGKMRQPAKQFFQPEQDPHTFDNRKFKADHKATAGV